MEFIDVFATKVRREPAMVEPMEIKVDQSKWQFPCNRAPPRRHSEEKQVEIRKQIDALLKLGVRLRNGVKFTLFLNQTVPGDSP